jgi:hypothetical protein
MEALKRIIEKWPMAVIGLLGYFGGMVIEEIVPLYLEHAVSYKSQKVLLGLLGISFVIIIILISSTIYIYYKSKTKLIPMFGILWDKNQNAYCNICKKLLSNHGSLETVDGPIDAYFCVNCKEFFSMRNDKREILTLTAAKDLLKEAMK